MVAQRIVDEKIRFNKLNFPVEKYNLRCLKHACTSTEKEFDIWHGHISMFRNYSVIHRDRLQLIETQNDFLPNYYLYRRDAKSSDGMS